MTSSGTPITDAPRDLRDAGALGLKPRIWTSVQNRGDDIVYFCELPEAPALTTDPRWQEMASKETVDMMASDVTPLWARCADGESSVLSALPGGRPTRY